MKPENLLLTTAHDDAEVKLVDFGFAIQVDGFSAEEKVGTPGYIAPEILEGKKYGKLSITPHLFSVEFIGY